MRIKTLTGIIPIFFFILLCSSCKDDGIYFTENYVIGDIVTEEEIQLESNMIMLSYNSGKTINIRGNKGECKAISSDAGIVKAEVYNGYRKSVSISIVKPRATATVTVQDESGQTATLEIITVDSEIRLYDRQLSDVKRYLSGKWELVSINDEKTGKKAPVENIFWEFGKDGCYQLSDPVSGGTINGCEEWIKKTTFKGYDAPFIGNQDFWIDRIHNDILFVYKNSDDGYTYNLVRREYPEYE